MYIGLSLIFVQIKTPPTSKEMTKSIPDHLLKLCFQKEIFAEISEQEEIFAKDRFEFARVAQKYISEAYAKD